MIAPVVAEGVAGRAAAGAAAKKGAAKGTRARGAGARKPAASSPAGGSTPPAPPAPEEQVPEQAASLLAPPGTKQLKNAKRAAVDAGRSLTLTPPRRVNARDASGFAFGLVLYALALSGIKYGVPEGPKGWLSAKFLNRVTLRAPSRPR
jgi:hypothetical protein